MNAVRGKGGGHSKGQTMPYAVVYAWAGGASGRSPKWTLGAAQEGMRTMLVTANYRELELDVKIIDRATGETLETPRRCLVCKDRWATEWSSAPGEDPTLCDQCDEDDLPADEPAAAAPAGLSIPLVKALQAKGLEPTAQPDGAVTVQANGIDWTLKPEPHAVTGEPCGVWSAVGPAGSRGQFVATNAADFIARRITP